MKLVLRVLKTVLRNKKKLFLKTVLKQKYFGALRQKQSCSHVVKDGCKNLQRFSFKLLKSICLSSEQGLIELCAYNSSYMHKTRVINVSLNAICI